MAVKWLPYHKSTIVKYPGFCWVSGGGGGVRAVRVWYKVGVSDVLCKSPLPPPPKKKKNAGFACTVDFVDKNINQIF